MSSTEIFAHHFFVRSHCFELKEKIKCKSNLNSLRLPLVLVLGDGEADVIFWFTNLTWHICIGLNKLLVDIIGKVLFTLMGL